MVNDPVKNNGPHTEKSAVSETKVNRSSRQPNAKELEIASVISSISQIADSTNDATSAIKRKNDSEDSEISTKKNKSEKAGSGIVVPIKNKPDERVSLNISSTEWLSAINKFEGNSWYNDTILSVLMVTYCNQVQSGLFSRCISINKNWTKAGLSRQVDRPYLEKLDAMSEDLPRIVAFPLFINKNHFTMVFLFKVGKKYELLYADPLGVETKADFNKFKTFFTTSFPELTKKYIEWSRFSRERNLINDGKIFQTDKWSCGPWVVHLFSIAKDFILLEKDSELEKFKDHFKKEISNVKDIKKIRNQQKNLYLANPLGASEDDLQQASIVKQKSKSNNHQPAELVDNQEGKPEGDQKSKAPTDHGNSTEGVATASDQMTEIQSPNPVSKKEQKTFDINEDTADIKNILKKYRGGGSTENEIKKAISALEKNFPISNLKNLTKDEINKQSEKYQTTNNYADSACRVYIYLLKMSLGCVDYRKAIFDVFSYRNAEKFFSKNLINFVSELKKIDPELYVQKAPEVVASQEASSKSANAKLNRGDRGLGKSFPIEANLFVPTTESSCINDSCEKVLFFLKSNFIEPNLSSVKYKIGILKKIIDLQSILSFTEGSVERILDQYKKNNYSDHACKVYIYFLKMCHGHEEDCQEVFEVLSHKNAKSVFGDEIVNKAAELKESRGNVGLGAQEAIREVSIGVPTLCIDSEILSQSEFDFSDLVDPGEFTGGTVKIKNNKDEYTLFSPLSEKPSGFFYESNLNKRTGVEEFKNHVENEINPEVDKITDYLGFKSFFSKGSDTPLNNKVALFMTNDTYNINLACEKVDLLIKEIHVNSFFNDISNKIADLQKAINFSNQHEFTLDKIEEMRSQYQGYEGHECVCQIYLCFLKIKLDRESIYHETRKKIIELLAQPAAQKLYGQEVVTLADELKESLNAQEHSANSRHTERPDRNPTRKRKLSSNAGERPHVANGEPSQAVVDQSTIHSPLSKNTIRCRRLMDAVKEIRISNPKFFEECHRPELIKELEIKLEATFPRCFFQEATKEEFQSLIGENIKNIFLRNYTKISDRLRKTGFYPRGDDGKKIIMSSKQKERSDHSSPDNKNKEWEEYSTNMSQFFKQKGAHEVELGHSNTENKDISKKQDIFITRKINSQEYMGSIGGFFAPHPYNNINIQVLFEYYCDAKNSQAIFSFCECVDIKSEQNRLSEQVDIPYLNKMNSMGMLPKLVVFPLCVGENQFAIVFLFKVNRKYEILYADPNGANSEFNVNNFFAKNFPKLKGRYIDNAQFSKGCNLINDGKKFESDCCNSGPWVIYLLKIALNFILEKESATPEEFRDYMKEKIQGFKDISILRSEQLNLYLENPPKFSSNDLEETSGLPINPDLEVLKPSF